MGFEIKNICTVVPNYYHKDYTNKAPNAFVYFSVFITPRLQFDGTLKEFYEMLHWPAYTSFFEKADADGALSCIHAVRKSVDTPIKLYRDQGYLHKLQEASTYPDIQSMREAIWQKLFRKDTPVIAWPILVSPQEAVRITPADVLAALKEPAAQDAFKVRTGQDLAGPRLAAMVRAVTIVANNPTVGVQTAASESGFVAATAQKLRQDKIRQQFETQKINQEFHKKVSTLARYPHLLRMAGLIHDFKIKWADIKDALPDAISLSFDKYSISQLTSSKAGIDFMEFADSVDLICPFTRVSFDEVHKMSAALHKPDDKEDKDPYEDYHKVVNKGFVKKEVITINQEYIENMTPLMTDQADAKANTGFNGNTFKPEDLRVIRQKSEHLLSKGFSIKIDGQHQELLTSMDMKLNGLTDETIKEFAFEAHHLDCGYRIDVKAAPDGEWRSLCRRQAGYSIDRSKDQDQTDLEPLLSPMEDEPWLEEVRQTNNAGQPRRIAEVARWHNWSLTCPPLHSKHVVQSDDPGNKEYNDLQLRDVLPLHLPHLRFDQDYSFRIRIADICGNGPDLTVPEPADCLVGGEKAIAYKRLEPILPPALFPDQLISRVDDDGKIHIDPAHMGEAPDTLVIRATVNEQGVHHLIQDQCVRYVMPAPVTTSLAEVSGQFDDQWFKSSQKNNLYAFLKSTVSDHYPGNDVRTTRLPYVFDPAVQGCVLFHDDPDKLPAGTARKLANLPFRTANEQNKLDNTKAQAIKVHMGPPNEEEGIFQVSPGHYRSIWVASIHDNQEVSAAKKINLIHAVQRPVLLQGKQANATNSLLQNVLQPRKVELTPLSADADKYKVILHPLVTDPVKIGDHIPATTVGEYILVATYHGLVLDSEEESGWRFASKPSVIRQNFNNLDHYTPEDALDTLLNDSDSFSRLSTPGIDQFTHHFPDAKAHQVRYQLMAVSKFASFFDASTLEDSDAFQQSYDFGELVIANSAKPDKPTITAIVPLFTTRPGGSRPLSKSGTYTFLHDGFRLYLGKTWYSTGFGEKIAVIYEQHNPVNLPDGDVALNKINIIGHDPKADSTEQTIPINTDSTFVTKDSVDIRLFNRSATDTTSIVPAILPEGKKYNHTIFEVQWDKARGEFYADITLLKTGLIPYAALLKLAVCRYQEHSLHTAGQYDYRFSDVVMTPMVSLLPARTVTLQNKTLSLDLHHKAGKRYDGHQYRPNLFYLIGEKKVVQEDITMHKTGSEDIKVVPITAFPHTLAIAGEYEKITLEEYEDIQLDHQAPDHLYLRPDNPRNDPGKRLVFFCPIK